MARQKIEGYKTKLESRPFTESLIDKPQSARVSLIVSIDKHFGNHELCDFDLDKFKSIFNRIANKAIKKMDKI